MEIKKLNDRNLINQIKQHTPTLVSFNGSGFDLHFLVKKICDI